MKRKILQTIKKYNLIQNGDIILIGVSGGPDSICLLDILNQLKEELNFKIYVAHINHMIRKDIGVECFVKREDVIKQSKKLKMGTEETGRQIRYNFFEEVLERTKANKIATAHNNNDKIETIIMNILRGSGTSGLKGIEAIRDNKYIRPLIEIDRQEIEEYRIENNLKPKIDKSNNENIYTRNKIRNIVIPYIKKEFNPNIIKTLNRLSEVATEENEYLNKITEKTFNEIRNNQEQIAKPVGAHDCTREKTNNEIILDLKKFNKLELVIKRRIILIKL